MYRRIHDGSTPTGVEGVGGISTSVTASRMTNAYGASTPSGVLIYLVQVVCDIHLCGQIHYLCERI